MSGSTNRLLGYLEPIVVRDEIVQLCETSLTAFVIIFIGALSVLLILAPLSVRLSRDRAVMQDRLRKIQHDTAKMLRDLDRYRMASENASDGLVIQDMKGRIIWCNPAYCRILGVEQDDILGRNPLEFAIPPDDRPSPADIAAFRYDPDDDTLKNLQLFRNQRPTGELFWNQLSVSLRTGTDGVDYAILVCRDISSQVEKENDLKDLSRRLEYQASHDSLTGIPNRDAFLSFIETALDTDQDGSVGLLHIDLDDFKGINDTHGHGAGDAVLHHIAQTIRSNLRPTDMVARIGGDEFVVVCRDCPELDYLGELGRRLIGVIAAPIPWRDRTLRTSASIGAAQAVPNQTDADDLLLKADFALYDAKDAGRGQVALYDAQLHQRYTSRSKLAAHLSQAIETGTIDFWFQPILDMRTRQVTGFETLARWVHPETGQIYDPSDFLPIVEEIGLLGQLDMLSMLAALKQKAAFAQSGTLELGLSFNASPDLLARPDFINRLIWAVDSANIDRSHITIEVLETTNFGNTTETASPGAIIQDLKQAGFRVFLDDFGAGFAGLAHLAALDLSGVKIDRSLITDILTDDVSMKVARKTIELCNDLEIAVVAEGVEDAATAQALQSMGCALVQGYWLASPMPASAIGPWLQTRSGPRALTC